MRRWTSDISIATSKNCFGRPELVQKHHLFSELLHKQNQNPAVARLIKNMLTKQQKMLKENPKACGLSFGLNCSYKLIASYKQFPFLTKAHFPLFIVPCLD